jgi:cobalt-precorrin 5A hydrolase/precorrin-3B C17-methyltransferase
VGVGAGRGVAAETVLELIAEALRAAGLDAAEVVRLATAEPKTAEPGLLAVAARLGVPLVGYPIDVLAGIAVPHPSGRTLAATGTPSVCEAAALAAAPGGRLVVPKRASPADRPGPRATVAVSVTAGEGRPQAT